MCIYSTTNYINFVTKLVQRARCMFVHGHAVHYQQINMSERFSYPEACISICYEVYNYICSTTLKVPTLHMISGIYMHNIILEVANSIII